MKIIIDEREHELYNKCYSIVYNEGNCLGVEVLKRVLPLGDILIQTIEEKDVMLIERKTFSDMLSSIRDGRYEEQSHRLIHSSGFPYHTIVYLLEGMMSQTTPKEKKLLFSTMTSLNYFKGFSIMRTSNVKETAEWIVWTTEKIRRDFMKGKIPSYLMKNQISGEYVFSGRPVPAFAPAVPPPSDKEPVPGIKSDETAADIVDEEPVPAPQTEEKGEPEIEPDIPAYSSVVKKIKRDNITPANIGEILLCQIPSVHSITAVAIMKKFSSFQHLMKELETRPECLDDIYTETNGKKRKISKSVVQNIRLYLLAERIN